jgi:hypothetical protein
LEAGGGRTWTEDHSRGFYRPLQGGLRCFPAGVDAGQLLRRGAGCCVRWRQACRRPCPRCEARSTGLAAGGPEEGDRRAGRWWLGPGGEVLRRLRLWWPADGTGSASREQRGGDGFDGLTTKDDEHETAPLALRPRGPAGPLAWAARGAWPARRRGARRRGPRRENGRRSGAGPQRRLPCVRTPEHRP